MSSQNTNDKILSRAQPVMLETFPAQRTREFMRSVRWRLRGQTRSPLHATSPTGALGAIQEDLLEVQQR